MQDARGLVSSLLIQLSEQSELCSEIISRLYSAHATGSVQAGDDALLECLKDMLSIPGQGPIYLILDGLDQSPDDPSARESVLDLIQLLVQLGHPHLHICVSVVSKPISEQFSSGQVEDINNYINFFIKTNANTSQWKDEDKEFVIKKVSEEADGMFRWASCRLYQLRRCPPGGILRTLDEFPKIMEVEYERMLQGIHEKQWEASHRLFQYIAVAPRPLQVSETCEFLAWDIKQGELPEFKAGWRYEDPEHAVYSACSSFITMTDANECQVVKFSHLSMKEFLSSDRLATSKGGTSRYYVSHEDAHTTVAQGLLATLFYLDEQVNKRSVTNFPLATYAAQYLAGALRRLFNGDKPQLSILVWINPTTAEATPIYYASLLGLCGIVRCLVYSDGSSVNGNGHYDIVMTLLDNGASPRIEGPGRRTALYSAAENGHLRVVELLLGRRSPPTTFFMRQHSPLGQALRNRHLRVAQLLLQNGARVDAQNGNGETILHQASNGGYDLESVQMLLDNHANTGLKDNQGRTALEIARESGQEEIVQLLLGHDPNTMH
ncbi:ankyrin repeat-containing domain protein [Multifurca ochricompacta]|uniref:Ankyrin repeat-containing domain protein n=1 Tax=Multifurca ochricompacta TaxID=376703 RepID=A0AAD4LZW1_9AGAM|nr:ankyrin repeat-containing domain protein [Multifurca ochricompacta]